MAHCTTQIVKTYIELGMGWTKGSLAPPSRITLRVQEQAIANEREDGVEVTANPDSGPHWAIHHEGNRSVRYIYANHNQYIIVLYKFLCSIIIILCLRSSVTIAKAIATQSLFILSGPPSSCHAA